MGRESLAFQLYVWGICAFVVGGLLFIVWRTWTRRKAVPTDPSQHWGLSTDDSQKDGAEFRYSKGTIAGFRWAMLGPAVLFSVLYLAARHSRAPMSPTSYLVLVIGGTAACALACGAIARRCVRVTHANVRIQKLFSERDVPFSEISEVNLLQGSKGELVLKLLDRSNKLLATIDGTLENFGSLTALIKERAGAAGARYRYRDMWGSWTN